MVEDCEYMFPIRFMESVGYPRSFIMAKSLAWVVMGNFMDVGAQCRALHVNFHPNEECAS